MDLTGISIVKEILTTVAALVGIFASWYALKKVRLEIKGLEKDVEREVEGARLSSKPDAGGGLHVSKKDMKSILALRSPIPIFRILAPTYLMIFSLIILAPMVGSAFPKNIVDRGWPGGSGEDTFWNAMYSTIPAFFAVSLSILVRRRMIAREAWFRDRGGMPLPPQLSKYLCIYFFSYLSCLAVMCALLLAEYWMYVGTTPNPKQFIWMLISPICWALLSTFVAFLQDVIVFSPRQHWWVVSLYQVFILTVVAYITFSIYYSPAQYGNEMTGAIWFSTISFFVSGATISFVLLNFDWMSNRDLDS